MRDGDKGFGEWVAATLRWGYGPEDMTAEEIDAFLDTVEDIPLPETQITTIIASLHLAEPRGSRTEKKNGQARPYPRGPTPHQLGWEPGICGTE